MPCISFCLSEQEMRNVLASYGGRLRLRPLFSGARVARERPIRRATSPAAPSLDRALLPFPMRWRRHTWQCISGRERWQRRGTPDDLKAIRRALGKIEFEGPGGLVWVDPSELSTKKHARVGQVEPNRTISEVWTSPAIAPIAYPGTRSSAQWEALLEKYRALWNGHWSNPALEEAGPG